MEQIYILQCKGGKYYVGKTADVMRRFEQHKNGKGSAWTKKYPPVRLMECKPMTSPHDENNITKDMMEKYGVENVRGGSYTQMVLPDEMIKAINMEYRTVADTCYKCNQAGHFANKCPGVDEEEEDEEDELVWGCDYCDREFTTQFGCMIHERSCKKTSYVETPKSGACYKCGREGHYSPDCYAKRHVDGYYLD